MRVLLSGVMIAMVGCSGPLKPLPPRAEKKTVVATAEVFVPGMT